MSPAETTVFGDSLTDKSLFEHFPHSVLVHNPWIPDEQRKMLAEVASYVSDLPDGDGFAEVVLHLLRARRR